MQKYSRSFRGFTIVELIVSIAVIGILLSLSFAGYARLNQRHTLISAGQNLKNIIRDAQSRAFNGEMDCNICDCESAKPSLKGWYVDFPESKIYGECDMEIGILTTYNFGEKSFNLPAEVVVTPHLTPPTKIRFSYNPPGADKEATVCLSQSDLTNSYYMIKINKSGEISSEDTLISTCPPVGGD